MRPTDRIKEFLEKEEGNKEFFSHIKKKNETLRKEGIKCPNLHIIFKNKKEKDEVIKDRLRELMLDVGKNKFRKLFMIELLKYYAKHKISFTINDLCKKTKFSKPFISKTLKEVEVNNILIKEKVYKLTFKNQNKREIGFLFVPSKLTQFQKVAFVHSHI